MAVVDDLAPGVLVTGSPWQKISVRILAVFFLTLLAVGLLLPPLQSVSGLVPSVPLDEHREPAAVPELSLLVGSAASKFADRFDAWFDDRIGFRDVAIRWAHDLDARLFSVSRKVYIGKENWFFERATTNARMYIERISEADYQEVETSFIKLAQDLRQRGIHLIVIDYPDKSEFYSEYLPNGVPNLPVDGRLARLRRALDTNPDIDRIDVGKLLQPLKPGGAPLFYKTDIHIGYGGSIPVVQEIVRRIAQLEGRDVAWNETFHWQLVPWAQGSEARFLAVSEPVPETVLSAPDFYRIEQPAADGHWVVNPEPMLTYPSVGRFAVFDWEYVSDSAACKNRLPATALFGNSFSDTYWSLGLQRYFCRLRRARTPTFRLRPYLDHLPTETKYFIFQYLAALLPGESPLFADAVLPVESSTPGGHP